MQRDIEEDRRMAAFLASKDYKGENWMTDDIIEQRWVAAGRPIYYEIPKVRGFYKPTTDGEEGM